jgi:hypothetical protein
MTKAVQVLNLDPTSSALVGNNMYSTQFSYTNNKSLADSIQDSLNNKLSYFSADKCFKTLKQHYNISDNQDLMISKTDLNSYTDLNNLKQPLVSNSMQLKVYNPVSRAELNISLCYNDTFTIKVPIKSKDLLNLTMYKDLNQSGIDAYNPDSDAFNSPCFKYIDKSTDYDTTINFRRGNYFLNKSAVCNGSNCTYDTIDENDYVVCNCTNISEEDKIYSEFLNYFLSPLSTWNFYVVSCYALILPVINYLTLVSFRKYRVVC